LSAAILVDLRFPSTKRQTIHRRCTVQFCKANKRVLFGYGLNYLIDIKHAVIVDVEATPARTYDEVAATKTMRRTRQIATLCRLEGPQAAGMVGEGQIIVERAPASTGRVALVTEASHYRHFAGWRSDPFFFDRRGMLNNLWFTGEEWIKQP
jgi:hypothetical protein